MRHRTLLLLAVGILFLSTGLAAQLRTEKPNDFTIELGGKCLLYSLNYNRTVSPGFGLTAGLSFFGGGGSDGAEGIFFLSGGARAYMIKKDATPYLEGGLVWISDITDAGPFDGNSGVYFYVSPGFEYRTAGGFLFRGGVNFLIKEGFFVWPGIHLGIAF